MSGSDWEGSDRSARRTTPVLVVVALLAGTAVAGLVFGHDERPPDGLVVEEATGPPVTVAYEPFDVVPQIGGTWQRTAPGPLAGRAGASAVWTGDEVMVWGGVGTRALVDGALYDPRRDRWRTVATAEVSPRYGHAAVWDGDEVVIAGGRAITGGDEPRPAAKLRDVVAYNPVTDRWRSLPRVPFDTGAGRLFAMDGRLYAVAPRAVDQPVALLDAGSAAWRLLPGMNWAAGGDSTAAAVLDGDLVLWPAARGEAVALDLRTRQWSSATHRARRRPVASCECEIMAGVMPSGSTDVIVYDKGAGEWWRYDVGAVRPSYAGGPESLLYLVQTPATTRLVQRTTGLALDTPTPPENLGFQPAAVWAGDRLFMFSGVSGVRRRFDVDGLTFTPGGRLGHSRLKVL